MKYALPLLAALLVSACDSVDQPPQNVRRVAKYPPEGQPPPPYPPQSQPFNPNGQPAAETTTTTTENTQPGPPPTAGATTKSKGDFPYGIPVPGKPHLVESPYSPGKFVDVEGFGPGQEVKDPYTGKIFLVP
ncbi:MAG: hypothetical protein QOG48_1545 [Verrucomicrobiota bacterium]|jgi:hypothetical protein